MTREGQLRPATAEEIAEALSFGLRFNGGRPFPQSSMLMAQITAEHLVKHLQRCGFVLMKQPDAAAPSTDPHVRK